MNSILVLQSERKWTTANGVSEYQPEDEAAVVLPYRDVIALVTIKIGSTLPTSATWNLQFDFLTAAVLHSPDESRISGERFDLNNSTGFVAFSQADNIVTTIGMTKRVSLTNQGGLLIWKFTPVYGSGSLSLIADIHLLCRGYA